MIDTMEYNTFDNVCQYLSKLTTTKNKKDAIQEWFSNVPRPLLYTILKFILPAYDTRIYKIKQTTLAKLLTQTFHLSKQDANTLLQWNKPNAYQISNNFGLLVYHVCKKYISVQSKNDITIQQIDTWLTLLTNDISFATTIFPQLNIVQLSWFCNIILKNIVLPTNLILKAYHPDAPVYWMTNRNLDELCATLVDYNKRYDVNNIKWGSNFCPMLCESTTWTKFDTLCSKTNVYVETKWDGERLVLHYRKNKTNDEYICFTRNGKNYTQFYKHLEPFFKSALSEFNDCIVDGEIVLIDKTTGKIAPKAEMFNGTNKLDYDMRFIIFDIVFVNNESIAMLPLSKRLTYLKKINCNEHVAISDAQHCSSRKDVFKLFADAVETRQEGIVIKYGDTDYQAGIRKKTLWLKMKPDYEDAIADDLDLVIIGGYYAEGSSIEKVITSFLVGFLDKKCGQFKSISSIGNGFTSGMYNELYTKLGEPVKYSAMVAKMFNLVLGHHTPDVLYNPMKSVILQIRVASVIESNSTGSKMNLRFPRCVCIRYDKKPFDTTFPMLSSLKETKTLLSVVSDESPPWKDCLWQQTPLVDKKTIIELDQLFCGLTFYVYTKTPERKQELEQMILQHGGTIYQSGHGTIIVAEQMGHSISVYAQKDHVAKLGNKKVQLKGHNIVKPSWVEECIQYGEIRAMNDENTLYSRENLFLQGSTFYFDPALGEISVSVKKYGANITTNPSQADNIVTRRPHEYKGIVAKFHTLEWIINQIEQFSPLQQPSLSPPQKNVSTKYVFIDSDLDMKIWKPKLESLGYKIATTFDASVITHVLIRQKPTALSFGTSSINKVSLYNQLRRRHPRFQYLLTGALPL